jgi:hypothetical protein
VPAASLVENGPLKWLASCGLLPPQPFVNFYATFALRSGISSSRDRFHQELTFHSHSCVGLLPGSLLGRDYLLNMRDEHIKPFRAENDACALSIEPLVTCGLASLSKVERYLSSACKKELAQSPCSQHIHCRSRTHHFCNESRSSCNEDVPYEAEPLGIATTRLGSSIITELLGWAYIATS